MSPKPGDAWRWHDGRATILYAADIARGYVTARTEGGHTVTHRIADGGPDHRRAQLEQFTLEQMRRGEVLAAGVGEA